MGYLAEWVTWIMRYARVGLGGFLRCLIPAELADSAARNGNNVCGFAATL